MTADRLARAVELFDQAIDLAVPEREAFIRDACRGDPELLARVRSMLQADVHGSRLLDATPDDLASAVDLTPQLPLVGRRFGAYTVLEILGRGGMGIVCLAQRQDVGKKVALKLVAGGLGSPELVARFHQERRVLAQLAHPNIASLVDAGLADDGTPWLAMEYIPGNPLIDHCDAERLPVKGRLELFVQVCEAVAHAHRHLVVHRDLKPGNILVGADGAPRLLDFGIAKLLDDTLAGDAALTRSGLRMMTPQYASPEQVTGAVISTASDIYQLGALLFELLTGRPPHPDRVAGLSGIATNPVGRPSRAVARPPDGGPRTPARWWQTAETIATARASTVDRLTRQLGGDLDNIVARATEQDPTRRYGTARELADDVRRFVEGLPVLARPATRSYRFRKFVARHKAGTAVVLTIVVASTALGLVLTRQARRIEAERVRAEQVSTLLADLFAGADPVATQGDSLTVASLLDQGAARVRSHSEIDPEVKGRLLLVISGAYRNLGEPAHADTVLDEAVLALRSAVNITDRTLLLAMARQGFSRALSGDLAGGTSLLAEAESTARGLGRDRQADLAEVLQLYGAALQGGVADRVAAREKYEEALTIFRSLPDSLPPGIEWTLSDLGFMAAARSDFAAAEQFWREVFDRRRIRLGPDHSQTARAMINLAGALLKLGRMDEAEQLTRDAAAIQRRVFERPNWEVVLGMARQAELLSARGQFAAAESTARQAIAIGRRVAGDSAGGLALLTESLATIVQRQGRLDEAAAIHREAIDVFTSIGAGVRNAATAIAMSNLAYNAFLRQSFEEAENLYEIALPLLDSAWEGSTRLEGPIYDYSFTLAVAGKCDEAEPHLRRAIQLASIDSATLGRGDVRPKRTLGWCLMRLGRYAEAEPILLHAHDILVADWGAEHAYTRSSAENLVELYDLWGKPEEASRYRNEGGAGEI